MYLDFQTQWSTMYYYTSAYLNMSHLGYMCIPHMDFFPVILCNAYLRIKYVCAFLLIHSSQIYQRNVKGGIKWLSIVVKLLAVAILFKTGLKPFLKKNKNKMYAYCIHAFPVSWRSTCIHIQMHPVSFCISIFVDSVFEQSVKVMTFGYTVLCTIHKRMASLHVKD